MRAFALAVLLALALLPKTGWIVRSHVEYLSGGYRSLGAETGLSQPKLVPDWSIRETAKVDAGLRALQDNEGRNALERLQRAKGVMSDPLAGKALAPFMLRRGFTSIVVSRLADPQAKAQMREIAHILLPLAEQGERDDVGNAFYPSCAWVLYAVLDHPADARAALARAAHCTRYDDEAVAEARYMQQAIERHFGYQGSQLRIHLRGQILLPQYAALRQLAEKMVAEAPLNDPARKDVLALAEVLMKHGTNRISILVGRGLALRAVTKGKMPSRPNAVVNSLVGGYAQANPGFDAIALKNLLYAADYNFEDTVTTFESALDAPYLRWGAFLLVALSLALVTSIPNLGGERPTLKAKLAVASWAWLAAPLGLLYEDRSSPEPLYFAFLLAIAGTFALSRRPWGVRPAAALGGLVAVSMGIASIPPDRSHCAWLVAPLIWAAGMLVPAAYNVFARSALIFLAAAASVWAWSTPAPGWMVAIGLMLVALAIRGALPQRKNLGWLPMALAVAYLGVVSLELMYDAQVAEVIQRLDQDADQFREERGMVR